MPELIPVIKLRVEITHEDGRKVVEEFSKDELNYFRMTWVHDKPMKPVFVPVGSDPTLRQCVSVVPDPRLAETFSLKLFMENK